MRISDWSSDVCSSDLADPGDPLIGLDHQRHEIASRTGDDHPRIADREFFASAVHGCVHVPRPLPFAGRDVRGHYRHPPYREKEQRERRDEARALALDIRSEEHTSELQSLMRISYAVFCLKKKNTPTTQRNITHTDHD